MSATHENSTQVDRLEARIAVLEHHLLTLTAALDAASRLRLTAVGEGDTVRVTGGELVRRILDDGGLVSG